MKTVLAVLALAATAAAWSPFPGGIKLPGGIDIGGKDSCTGSGDPPASYPSCYEGKASVLGMSETVKVDVKSYADGKGVLNLHASGVTGEDCGDRPFTKTGQDIAFDTGCLSGAKVSAKYCSDSDTITVDVTPKQVPIPVSATLKKVAC